MRIAILHYHLRPGGVTRVIQNALKALENSSLQFIVLSGEAPSPTMPVPNSVIVEPLEYTQPSKTYPSAGKFSKNFSRRPEMSWSFAGRLAYPQSCLRQEYSSAGTFLAACARGTARALADP